MVCLLYCISLLEYRLQKSGFPFINFVIPVPPQIRATAVVEPSSLSLIVIVYSFAALLRVLDKYIVVV